MRKGLIALASLLAAMPLIAQSYGLVQMGTGSNPPNAIHQVLNQEWDNETETAGWTKILADSLGKQSYSTKQDIPFGFAYAGATVSEFWVASTGYVAFSQPTSEPKASVDTFLTMPIAGLPSKVIYVGGVNLDGDNDAVYTKVFGTFPHRQLWIRFHSASCSQDRYAYYSIVLEESSYRIHVVEQMADLSNTVRYLSTGLQWNNTESAQLWENHAWIYDGTRFTHDNRYQTFEWSGAYANDWQIGLYNQNLSKYPLSEGTSTSPFRIPVRVQALGYQGGGELMVNTYANGVWVDSALLSIPLATNNFLGEGYEYSLYPQFNPANLTLGQEYEIMHVLQVNGDNNQLNDTVRQRWVFRDSRTGAVDSSQMLVESFTASWCSECPMAQDYWMDSLERAFPGQITWIQHHSYDGIQPSLSPVLQRYSRLPTSEFYPVEYPSAFINRMPTFGPGFVMAPNQWVEGAMQVDWQAKQKTFDVEVLNLLYDTLTQIMTGDVKVTARNYCWADEVHIGGSLLETSVRGLGFGFNQSVKSAWTSDSNSLYFGKNNPMVGYTHKRAALASLFGGEEPGISDVHEVLAPGDQRVKSFSIEVPVSAINIVIPDGADFGPAGVVTGRGKLADFRVLAYAWEAQHNNWTQEDFAPIVAIDEQPLWDLVLSTDNGLNKGFMQVFPNPASDWIAVNADDQIISTWEFIDVSGRSVLSGVAGSNAILRLNVSALNAGTYWLRCQTLEGQLLTQPLIKASF